jgi:hypothetical protein
MDSIRLDLELVPSSGALVWRLPILGLVVACPLRQDDGRVHFEVSIVLDGIVNDELRENVINLVRTQVVPQLPGRCSLLLRDATVVLPIES